MNALNYIQMGISPVDAIKQSALDEIQAHPNRWLKGKKKLTPDKPLVIIDFKPNKRMKRMMERHGKV
jgi:hypothetical protein